MATQVYENQACGTTVELGRHDDLDSVPESHRDMITPSVRQVFEDPPTWFRQLAARSTILPLSQWLETLVDDGHWRLLLHEGYMYERMTLVAFYWQSRTVYWQSRTVQSAMISLAREALSPRIPQGFRHYYSLVDKVHWEMFGCSGGLLGSQDQIPLAAFSMPRPKRKGFDSKKCVVWGNSACGDMLIYNEAGKAAFLSHENSKVQSLGTIEEAIGWVFQQLLENRTPEFDYSRA